MLDNPKYQPYNKRNHLYTIHVDGETEKNP